MNMESDSRAEERQAEFLRKHEERMRRVDEALQAAQERAGKAEWGLERLREAQEREMLVPYNAGLIARAEQAEQQVEAAEAEAFAAQEGERRFGEALERLRNGPDTVTQAGLRIVNNALQDEAEAKAEAKCICPDPNTILGNCPVHSVQYRDPALFDEAGKE